MREAQLLPIDANAKLPDFPRIRMAHGLKRRSYFEGDMFIDEMVNQGATPVIEQTLKFTSARQRLLEEDVANISTPGFIQKDLSPEKFQAVLRERLAASEQGPRGRDLSGPGGDLGVDVESPKAGILFHDGNNRSVEELMSAGMKNALTHNLMIELLKKQFATMELALQQK